MANYKVLATIGWKIESSNTPEECIVEIKNRINGLINNKDFPEYDIQVDITPMKVRKHLQHIAVYPAEEILSLVTEHDSKRDFEVNGEIYTVRMNSDRYLVFRNNAFCAACGIQGTKMHLDLNPGDSIPHFNLYAEEGGKLVLMTKDHKIPKSKGGENALYNYVTCCSICNNLKGDSSLDYNQVGELRSMFSENRQLSRKELRNLINKTRQQMVELNESKLLVPMI